MVMVVYIMRCLYYQKRNNILLLIFNIRRKKTPKSFQVAKRFRKFDDLLEGETNSGSFQEVGKETEVLRFLEQSAIAKIVSSQKLKKPKNCEKRISQRKEFKANLNEL